MKNGRMADLPQIQVFGDASFFGPQSLEAGYISLPKIVEAGIELDLHFTPRGFFFGMRVY